MRVSERKHIGRFVSSFYLGLHGASTFPAVVQGLNPTNHQDANVSSRRTLLKDVARIGTAGCLVLPLSSEPAQAARGAFELDSEYYIRDLLGGNKKEGNVLPSRAPAMPPPRSLQGPLVPLLLDQDYAPSCIPVQALAQQMSKGGTVDTATAKAIAASAMDYRSKSSRSFATRAQWDKEDIVDQYYFDLSAYALWKTAADSLPKYADRDIFARNVGRLLYQKIRSESLVKQQPQQKILEQGSVVGSETAVKEVLALFQDSNFCKGFKIGNDQSVGEKQEEKVFDPLDDEALQNGASINCLVSVYEPATLGASLQITGEQSRFAPDYVGSTLAALWESMGIKCSWEIFFVDPEYRPNPKDYFPNEKLLQFTLTLQ